MKRFQDAMEFFYKKHFKVSVFFSVFMKSGIVFFSLAKTLQGKSMVKSIPKSYLLLSATDELAKIIALVVQKKVDFLEWKTEKTVNLSSISIEKNTQVILDNEFVSFKDCIFIQEVYRNKGITFRIIPKNSGFIIGSDSNSDRGEVVKMM